MHKNIEGKAQAGNETQKNTPTSHAKDTPTHTTTHTVQVQV